MNSERPRRAEVVIGPAGQPLTVDNLPSPETKRWVVRRKAEVVLAVRGGLISFEEVCERYRLSKEELRSWGRLLDRHGVAGLRTMQLQNYRVSAERRAFRFGLPGLLSGDANKKE